jgi:hypothetical protein
LKVELSSCEDDSTQPPGAGRARADAAKGSWTALTDLDIGAAHVLHAGGDGWPLAEGVTAQPALEVGR